MVQENNARELQIESHKVGSELLIFLFLVVGLLNSFSRFSWVTLCLVGSLLLLMSMVILRKVSYRQTLLLNDQSIEWFIERKGGGKEQKRRTKTYSPSEIESIYIYGSRIGFKLKNKRIVPFALFCSDIDDKLYVKEWAKKHQIAVHYRFFRTWY